MIPALPTDLDETEGWQTYRLYMNWSVLAMLWLTPMMFTVFPLALGVVMIARPREAVVMAAPAILSAGIAAFWWRRALRTTRQIIVRPGGPVVFVTGLRRITVSPGDIVSIEPERAFFGYLVVRQRAGRVLLLNQITGLHRFLSDLQSSNPSVKLVGC